VFEGREPQVLEPSGLDACEGSVDEIGERRPAPECERVAQEPRRLYRLGVPGGRDEALEPKHVDRFGLDLYQIAGASCQQRAAGQKLAGLGDVHLKRLERGPRWV